MIDGAGTGQMFITPRVKRIIDLANEEANRLKDEYISTEHVFLAILSERILAESGITKEQVNGLLGDVKEKRPEGPKTVRVSVDLSLTELINAIERLPTDEARRIYDRIGKRLGFVKEQ